MKDEELKAYYSRLQSEFQLSHNKKDTMTNWSLTIVLASLAAYFSFSIEVPSTSIIKLALPVGTLMIVIQFFVTSLLAYGYLSKWRLIRKQIEKYWIDGNPPLNKILKLIQKYDHEDNLNVNKLRILRAQLVSGFLIILGIPSFLIGYEILKIQELTIFHIIVIVTLIIYLIYSTLSVTMYRQFNYVDEKTILEKI